jgi:hypothetical protein
MGGTWAETCEVIVRKKMKLTITDLFANTCQENVESNMSTDTGTNVIYIMYFITRTH